MIGHSTSQTCCLVNRCARTADRFAASGTVVLNGIEDSGGDPMIGFTLLNRN